MAVSWEEGWAQFEGPRTKEGRWNNAVPYFNTVQSSTISIATITYVIICAKNTGLLEDAFVNPTTSLLICAALKSTSNGNDTGWSRIVPLIRLRTMETALMQCLHATVWNVKTPTFSHDLDAVYVGVILHLRPAARLMFPPSSGIIAHGITAIIAALNIAINGRLSWFSPARNWRHEMTQKITKFRGLREDGNSHLQFRPDTS